MIELICLYKETQIRKKFPDGTSLFQIALELDIKLQYPILGALVNNKVKEMTYKVYKPKLIEFIDFSHNTGYQMYLRSLSFVLYHDVNKLYPDAKLIINHSISVGNFANSTYLEYRYPSMSSTTSRHRWMKSFARIFLFCAKSC